VGLPTRGRPGNGFPGTLATPASAARPRGRAGNHRGGHRSNADPHAEEIQDADVSALHVGSAIRSNRRSRTRARTGLRTNNRPISQHLASGRTARSPHDPDRDAPTRTVPVGGIVS